MKIKNYYSCCRRFLLLASFFLSFLFSSLSVWAQPNCRLEISRIAKVWDISRTESAWMYVASPQTKQDIRDIIQYARENGLKISIKGSNHSHGGHNRLREGGGYGQFRQIRGIQLDMMDFGSVLKIDLDGEVKTVTVQPGLTWRNLAQILNPLGLAVKTEQSSNIFSIGGAIATNIHGRDIYGPLIRSVREVKFLSYSGEEMVVSRDRHLDIFRALFGSYGALGVITEVTLQLQSNDLLEAHVFKGKSIDEYLRFIEGLAGEPESLMHFGRVRISGDPATQAFNQVSWVKWVPIEANSRPPNWKGWSLDLNERFRWISSMLMNLMRARPTSRLGIGLKEYIDEYFGMPKEGQVKSKNNIMNNPVQFLFDNYYNARKSVDILQEYFLPPEKLRGFLMHLKNIASKHDLTLMNVTLRYVPKVNREEDGLLTPYSQEGPQIAVVLYFNIDESRDIDQGLLVDYDGSEWTQELIGEVHKLGGTFYWPYHKWWNTQQIVLGQENSLGEFFHIKQDMDPENLFTNDFLEALSQSFRAYEKVKTK